MLTKYTRDIRSRGSVLSYSTCHSERQHKKDAKRPSKRTNGHNNYTHQVSKYYLLIHMYVHNTLYLTR